MFGFKELIIVLVVVVLVFGTKKLRNMGGDLGGGIKSFKDAMKEGDEAAKDQPAKSVEKDDSVIEGEAKKVDEKKDV